jgi:hypothetical protein
MPIISYTRWLVRLTKHFFGPQFAGQRVRLMVTREMLDQTFPDLGGAENFLSATRAGPEWIRAGAVLSERGLTLFSMWKHRSSRGSKYPLPLERLKDVPPYLPYLCLLCLAWTEERPELQPHDFYARLSGLYPNHGLNHRLGEWECLWRGLEEWTVGLNKKWGHFVFEVLGQMSYVGIPKSQVILTPCKVDRLPELFTACSLQPTQLTPESIGIVIRAHAGPAHAVLGDSVFTEITRNTPLGQSALVLLGEYLENWDGVPPKKTGEDGHGSANYASQTTSLMLVLGIQGEGESWSTSLGLRDFREARGLQFTDKDWCFVGVQPGLVILRDAHGTDVTPEMIAGDWTDGITLTARWHAELADADPLRLVLPRERGVRVFEQAWGTHRLVEGTTLPTRGGLFVLVGPQSKRRWQDWCRRHLREQLLTDCTREGLPIGHEVWHINDLSNLSAAARVQFPSCQDLPSARPRALRLVGGTRARSNAARRVYARYDPPNLTMWAPLEAQLLVEGAIPKALPCGSRPAGLPGETEQRFTLQIDPEASVIIARAQLDGETIEAVTFGILSEDADAEPLPGQKVSVSRFGEVDYDAGVEDYVMPAKKAAIAFCEGTLPLGSPLAPGALANHPADKLLESLAIDHHSGRVPIPEFRRRAEEITRVAPWRLYLETRWLSHLGHIEIQTDSWGRWSYVHPNPLRLHCLPWKSSGTYYAVLAGCSTRAAREAAIEIASSLDCRIFVKDNGCKMVPPRILFAHQELEAFEVTAMESKIGWTPQPEAFHLSRWSAGLDEWREHLVWHPDRGPAEVAEYVPSRFQVTAADHHSAPFRLQCVEDPYTRRHRWHKLIHNDAIGFNGLRHAFVRDAAWGMWKAQNAISDDEYTNLPFDSLPRELVVPFTLEFPYLLARALALSSGLVPRQVINHRAYATRTVGVLPDDSPLYTGECWAYGPVPQPIAELVATKVSAQLKILD